VKEETNVPKKKIKLSHSNITNVEIFEMCLRFLNLDESFFRRTWNWDEFICEYNDENCDEVEKLYKKRIVAKIFRMTEYETGKLNELVSTENYVKADIRNDQNNFDIETTTISADENGKVIKWKFESKSISNVEGIFLSIFNESFKEYYEDRNEIVRVDTTKINLRSLALGISSGKAICLQGPVGCGKSTLVEYLAKKVGRIPPKSEDYCAFVEAKKQKSITNSNKRKIDTTLTAKDDKNSMINFESGFLRIQLGDQTDSKVLLGQYRCTDIPGEFIWQPGVLTQAVMKGYWLLLEDIDTATQDVFTVLTNLLENNFLCVPGYRENLKIAHGFQLFVTLR
jgi:midasin